MIINYVKKFPLQTIRNIADNYSEKRANYSVIKKDVKILVEDEILLKFGKNLYYFTPQNDKIKMLITIIRSRQILQRKFRKIKFDDKQKDFTFDGIIAMCISLFYYKLKILRIDVRRGKFDPLKEIKKLERNYIKFLKNLPEKSKQSEKQYHLKLSNAFTSEYQKDERYFHQLIYNKKSSKETLEIIEQMIMEDKKSVSLRLGITNKSVDMGLKKFKNQNDLLLFEILYDLAESEENRNLDNAPTNSEITKVMFRGIGKKLSERFPDKKLRKKKAKELAKRWNCDIRGLNDLFGI